MTRGGDVQHLRRALALAERGWGRVEPNPLVGAVVVRDGEVVGEGYHAEFGGRHAEVDALAAAGERARGATLYVTLEPCHHEGKTGPCTRAIADAGIARVVCSLADPNPEAGGGAEYLRERGVEVELGVCAQEGSDLNAHHLNAHRRQRTFVALKYALSLDARLAERPGVPSRVTDAAAIVEAHRLRAGHSAVMVGIGTVLADDPQLTVREWRAPRVAPLRIVLDSRLRLPPGSRLVQTAREVPVWVFTSEAASAERKAKLESLAVRVVCVPLESGGGLDLGAVLATLWKHQVTSVLCEGGGRLGSALLAAGRVDRFYAFVAPKLFGEAGVSAFQGPRGRAPLDWRLIRRTELGPVTLLTLSPEAGVNEEVDV